MKRVKQLFNTGLPQLEHGKDYKKGSLAGAETEVELNFFFIAC